MTPIIATCFPSRVYSKSGVCMGIRENFLKLVDKKQQEIVQHELQIREARAYIQALQGSMKFLPRDAASAAGADHSLRPDSTLAKARDAIRGAGTAPAYSGHSKGHRKATGQEKPRFTRWHDVELCARWEGIHQNGAQYVWPDRICKCPVGNDGEQLRHLPDEFGSMQR